VLLGLLVGGRFYFLSLFFDGEPLFPIGSFFALFFFSLGLVPIVRNFLFWVSIFYRAVFVRPCLLPPVVVSFDD